jgi:23S rRNA pseudouridine2457 synthase
MSKIQNTSSKTYLAFHKPYGVLSQFSKEKEDDSTLKDYLPKLSGDIYPIGRLDKDSEGLLLLTNDNKLKTRLLDPNSKFKKTYWVQVDGQINKEAIEKLKHGVTIRINKKDHLTLPCDAKIIFPPSIPDRFPPIRFRKSIPTAWIEISIVEGKNRQIRKMGAAVGFPVLRLIRISIGQINLGKLKIGESRIISKYEI